MIDYTLREFQVLRLPAGHAAGGTQEARTEARREGMADMSMKLENIIKSLRYCCGDLDVTRVCHKCPYHMPEDADRMCIDELMSEAADAIEKLSGVVKEAERDRDEYKERLDKTNDLIMDELKRIRVKQQVSEDGRT